MAIFFIEGPDRCGKSTQIKRLMSRLAREDIYEEKIKPIQWLHFSAIRNVSPQEQKNLFKATFKHMFKLLAQPMPAHWILDRTHLGDYVYAPMYRNDYDTDYVFELERTALSTIASPCLLILLYDSSFENLKRDDGDSLNANIDLEKAKEEVLRFKDAWARSGIKAKIMVDIKDKNPDEVETEIWEGVKAIAYDIPKLRIESFRKRIDPRPAQEALEKSKSSDD